MKIEVLGGGCANCANLHEAVKSAVEENGLNAEVVKETSYEKIIEYGITATPAVVVDGKVMSTGKVLSKSEVAALLKSVS